MYKMWPHIKEIKYKACMAISFILEILNFGLFCFGLQLLILHIRLIRVDLTTFEKLILEKGEKPILVLANNRWTERKLKRR